MTHQGSQSILLLVPRLSASILWESLRFCTPTPTTTLCWTLHIKEDHSASSVRPKLDSAFVTTTPLGERLTEIELNCYKYRTCDTLCCPHLVINRLRLKEEGDFHPSFGLFMEEKHSAFFRAPLLLRYQSRHNSNSDTSNTNEYKYIHLQAHTTTSKKMSKRIRVKAIKSTRESPSTKNGHNIIGHLYQKQLLI